MADNPLYKVLKELIFSGWFLEYLLLTGAKQLTRYSTQSYKLKKENLIRMSHVLSDHLSISQQPWAECPPYWTVFLGHGLLGLHSCSESCHSQIWNLTGSISKQAPLKLFAKLLSHSLGIIPSLYWLLVSLKIPMHSHHCFYHSHIISIFIAALFILTKVICLSGDF